MSRAEPVGPPADTPGAALAGATGAAPVPAPAAGPKKSPLATLRGKMGGTKAAGGARPWWQRVPTIAAVIALVLIVGLYVWVKVPPGVEAYSEAVPAEDRDRNALLAGALVGANIEDAFIDINDERAYIAYNLPGNNTSARDVVNATGADDLGADPDLMQRFVVGAAATVAPDVDQIVAVQYIDHRPSFIWTVQMDDFKAFMKGTIDVDEFDGRVESTHV